ncbi:Serine/threonine-protein phosphatase 6 regulatory ankyrin repeat subunit A [Orchesella cincta]|uniref:Serine/threonine-protein phosphatase 6 regulatory ankyrin repeat subunit A n=1 Tax=Orchesella cincta TaxID=48709 RepID=A0A1D2N5C5_ORCCI|nr:Serine/threonine-protein phosphatase 6 regulatory ankyrin repeat subunit A [Orchesella cincta]
MFIKQTVKERTRSGKVPLHFCAESGSVQCLDLVLSMEPFLVNTQDEEGYTPLHLAVINGNKDAVRRLVTAGADLNCLDNEKHSLVHWATVCGEVEILNLLLSNGAPASTPDIHLAHPIHYAAQMCGTVNGVSGGSRARFKALSMA